MGLEELIYLAEAYLGQWGGKVPLPKSGCYDLLVLDLKPWQLGCT